MVRPNTGFTLIEMMITVAIIGILGAFVYPLYSEYVKRVHRSQIVVLLSEQAQSLERFYTKNGLYSGLPDISSGNENYSITTDFSDHAFLLMATRKDGSPMADDLCGNFTLAHTGLSAITQAAPGITAQQCWGR